MSPGSRSRRSPSPAINGQYFGFVAEPQGNGLRGPSALGQGRAASWATTTSSRAASRPATGSSCPASRRSATALQSSPRADGIGRYRHVRRHLHPASDPRERLLAGHHPGRRASRSRRCRSRSSPSWRRRRSTVTAFYTGRERARWSRSAVTTPLEQAINGVEGMQYMTSSSGNNGTCTDHGHLRRRPATSTSPRSTCRTASRSARGRLPNEVKTVGVTVTKASSRLRARPPASTPTTTSTTRCSSATTSTVFVRDDAQARARRRRRHHLRRAQVRDAPLARSRPAGRPRHHRRPTWSTRCASRTCRWRPGRSAQPPARAGPDLPDQRARGRPPDRARRVRQHHPQAPAGRHARAPEGRRPRRARRRELLDATCATTARTPSASASSQLPTANALDVYRDVRRASSTGCRSSFPPGLKYEVAFDTTTRRVRVDPRGRHDAARGDRARRPRHVPVPAELAHARSSRRSRSRCRSSARSRSSSCSASRSTR